MTPVPVSAPATENKRTAVFHVGLQRFQVVGRQYMRVREKDDLVTGQVAYLLNARQGPHVDGQMSLGQGLVYAQFVDLPVLASGPLDPGVRFVVEIVQNRCGR